ncbi:hypothetical protein C7377_0742 [Balneicella halophila]|uniref:Phosphoesterase n=1 Tax=Balneicella halophila TaxID=1537566 RepID=A0A7L4URM8_BALHA|nr:metallophosphoesterase family protein [Balneicella halophila]PVX52428.1 hypothetical protein C7377_0742 [Balneicella halophila]
MQKIGLLSDTHSYLDPQLKEFFAPCDEIWHAGDVGSIEVINQLEQWKPLRCVYGNIDDHKLRAEFPEIQFFYCEKVKVLMIHIGGKPKAYRASALAAIGEFRPQLFICGHSHILKVEYDKEYEMLFVNPGASGKHGFHHVRTAVRFTIENENIKDFEIIELGVRG